MELRLLGPVQAWTGHGQVALGARRQRLVLALLALEVNSPVPLDRLIHLGWSADPPASARRIVHTHISRLRGALARTGEPATAAPTLQRRGGGYLLRADPTSIDVHLFGATVRRGREATDPADRVRLLRAALALWRGPALADTVSAESRARLCAGLEEARLTALEDRVEAELSLGRHQALTDELRGLTAEYPDRPVLLRQFVLALYRGGRSAEALTACRAFRRRMTDELGMDPGPELATLELNILRAAPTLDLSPPVPASPVVLAPRPVGSAPAPADGAGFTGRLIELAGRDGPVAALTNLGNLSCRNGELRRAVSCYRRALATVRPDDRLTAAATQANLGMTYRILGQPGRSVSTLTTALAGYQRLGATGGEALALTGIGTGWHDLGLLTAAVDCFEQALSRYRAIGDQPGAAQALAGLAGVQRDLGAHADALDLARGCRRLAERSGAVGVEADAMIALASTFLALGEYELAAGWYDEVIVLTERMGNRYAHIEALSGRALIDSAGGAHERALGRADAALAAAHAAGYRLLVGSVLGTLARIRLDQGRPLEATQHAKRAVTVHRATGCRLGEARAVALTGDAWQASGRLDRAAPRWRTALDVFVDAGARAEADRIRAVAMHATMRVRPDAGDTT